MNEQAYLPSIKRPCNNPRFQHCFHATGMIVTAGDDAGPGPFTHGICCHCGMSAVQNGKGEISLHGAYLPPPTPSALPDIANAAESEKVQA